MRRVVRHADKVAIGLLLGCGGVGLGMVASSLTSSAVTWERPSRFAELEAQPAQTVDQFASGRAWARAAFDGGLSRCPEMNADFVAGCQAEIKALNERPKLAAGSYGGPLLVTTYAPPMPEIEDEPMRPSVDEIELAAERSAAAVPAPAIVPATFDPTPDNYPAAAAEPQ